MKKTTLLILFCLLFFNITIYSESLEEKLNQASVSKLTELIHTGKEKGEQDNKKILALLHFFRGRKYYDQDDLDRAMKDMKTALQYDSHYMGYAYVYVALIYFDKADYLEAFDTINKAFELNITTYDAYVLKGQILSELEKYKEAIASLTVAVSLDKENSAAYIHRGEIYKKLKQKDYLELAYNDFLTAFKCAPQMYEIAFFAADIAFLLERYDEVLYYMDQVLKAEDKTKCIDAYYIKAFVYFIKGNTMMVDETVHAYLKYRVNSSKGIHATVYRSIEKSLVYIQNDKFNCAEQELNHALALSPNERIIYFIRMMVYKKLATLAQSKEKKEQYDTFFKKDRERCKFDELF